MKKLIIFLMVFSVAASVFASTPMPSSVKRILRNTPKDALVGIGVAKAANQSMSMRLSETRARASLTRQLAMISDTVIVEQFIQSYFDPATGQLFRDVITRTISQARFSGSYIAGNAVDKDGATWTVIVLKKEDALKAILEAKEAGVQAVPAMASFDMEQKFDNAFNTVNKMDPFIIYE